MFGLEAQLSKSRHFSRDINNIVMEMLIMAYACKTSTARKIVGVIPYLPYSRQCKLSECHLILYPILTFACSCRDVLFTILQDLRLNIAF